MTSIIGVPLLIDNQIEGVQLFFKYEIPQPTFPNELFKAIINNYRDGVIVADHKGDIMWVNPAFVKITGYRFDEVYGKNPRILKSGIQTKEFYQEMWSKLLSTGHYSVELWNRKKNGNIYPQWTDFFILKDQEGNISNIISIFKDLDDVDQVNRNLLLMIQKDPMTMVYNRTYFLELMEKKLKKWQNQTSYLLFLDINNFKPINDTYGHYIGDQVLIQYANSLMETFKGAIVSRYGGDEFLIHINSITSREELTELIDQFNPIVKVDDLSIYTPTSIGIVEINSYTPDINELINKADQAMYMAKRKRLKYLFYSENTYK